MTNLSAFLFQSSSFSRSPVALQMNCKAQYGRMINYKGHSKQMWRLKYASSLFIFSDQTQLRRSRKPSARPQTLRSFAAPFCAKRGWNSAVHLLRLLPFLREMDGGLEIQFQVMKFSGKKDLNGNALSDKLFLFPLS